jgi:serine/threonine protein phosphatase 1
MILAKAEDLRVDPSKKLIFTVGNVNGNPSLLTKIIEEIEESQIFCKNDKVVFLGNFIGATGDTRSVIDILKDYQKDRPDQAVVLRGAREQKMLCAKPNFFKSNLGSGVLKSYRRTPAMYNPQKNSIQIDSFVRDSLWLGTLPMFHQSDRYFFVHAGVNPTKDLDKQNLGGFMFIQDEFYKSGKMYSHMIVHSHKGEKPIYAKNRFGVGQGQGKTLSCCVMNDMPSAKKHVEEVITVRV